VVINLQVGKLVICAVMSNRMQVDIHLSNVIYMPGSRGTTLTYRELQRGGMRIRHGTTIADPKLFLFRDTLYVQLDAEYAFPFEVGAPEAPACGLPDCNRMRAAGFEHCTHQHGLEARRRRQANV